MKKLDLLFFCLGIVMVPIVGTAEQHSVKYTNNLTVPSVEEIFLL